LAALTAFTSLGLHAYNLQQVPMEVRALTGLRSLDLSDNELVNLEGVVGLRQLTSLDVTSNWRLRVLPADLGAQLSALQQLKLDSAVMREQVPTLPSTVTRLEVGEGDADARRGAIDGAWGALRGLRHLDVSGMFIAHPSRLARRTALEVLVLRSCLVNGIGSAFEVVLADLPNLRHLDLEWVRTYRDESETEVSEVDGLETKEDGAEGAGAGKEDDISEASAQGGLFWYGNFPQLTHLNLSSCSRDWQPMEQLRDLGVLPRLQQLLLADSNISDMDELGPWLVLQPALTYLDLSKNPLLNTYSWGVGGLKPLPQQLKVLRLEGRDGCPQTSLIACFAPPAVSLRELPPNLAQLTGLSELHLSGNSRLLDLPDWLSCLRHLELLDLRGTCMYWQHDVLASLPALRRVWLSARKGVAAEVFAGAQHLHFAEQAPQVAW
jgi:hypothetical protein